ncbi:hypothetical protein [Brevibacillus massiliensis]|uniref:hypothetical protein n=1 Tax=Brevibacillus massiliensis TaxID=1118054 RepID=UPI0003083262|nr:hypothetical protein [Brevibacillus massiliensis]
MYLVLSATKNDYFLPPGSAALHTLSYDHFLQSLRQYQPSRLIVSASMIEKPAWHWIPETVSAMSEEQFLFILSANEMDRYLLEQVLLTVKGRVILLAPNMTNQEIQSVLEGNGALIRHSVQPGYVITLVGTGGSGVTTFLYYFLLWLHQTFPSLNVLAVDLGRKSDLAAVTDALNYQLREYRAVLQRDDEELDLVAKPVFQNIRVVNAVGDWNIQELSRFLDYSRKNYDLILLDRGFLQTNDADWPFLKKESDESILVVRPDAFSLSYAKRIALQEREENIRVLLTHFQHGFVTTKEVEAFLRMPIMGVFSYQKYLIPTDLRISSMELNKRMKRDFQSLAWATDKLQYVTGSGFWSRITSFMATGRESGARERIDGNRS